MLMLQSRHCHNYQPIEIDGYGRGPVDDELSQMMLRPVLTGDPKSRNWTENAKFSFVLLEFNAQMDTPLNLFYEFCENQKKSTQKSVKKYYKN